MKKQFQVSLILFIVLAFVLINCGKKKDDPAPGGGITPPPTTTTLSITNVNPASGGEGTKVVITGTGFSTTLTSKKVKFGATEAVLDSATTTRLVTKVPKGATTGKVTVEVGGKTASSSTDFTVSAATTPAAFSTDNTSSDITAETAKVSSTLTANGGAAITQYGHVWSDTKTEPTTADAKTELGKTDGPFPLKFTSDLKSLKVNTTYNMRAYATNDKGTSYGLVATLKTFAAIVSVTSNMASSAVFVVTATSINITGGASFPAGGKLGEVGFCYSDTKPDPTVADPKIVDPSPFQPDDKKSASFKAFLPNLKPTTNYQVRPFATIDNVVYYGTTVKITTQANLSAATLTRKADFPGKTIAGAPVLFVIGDKLYLNARRSNADDSQFFVYDPGANTWTPKADLPMTGTAYKGATSGISFTHNGKGYFGFSSSFSAKKELWEYDAATDKWKIVATLAANPFGFYFLQTESVYLNGKVYAITYDKQLMEFDVDSRKTVERAMPPGFEASSNHLIVRDKTLYFYNSSSAKQSFAEYNAQTNTWVSKGKIPYTSQMLTVGNALYAFGSGVASLYDSATDSWKALLNLGTASEIQTQYGQAFSPFVVFPRSSDTFMGLKGAGTGSAWFEFKP